MKHLPIAFLSVLMLLAFINLSCKKNKSEPVNTTCGCDATATKYTVANGIGKLFYFSAVNKWTLLISPNAGEYYYHFPCNTNQDSLKAILNKATHNDTFQVTFSGKVKELCPGDVSLTIVGITLLNYIIVDSLKRN